MKEENLVAIIKFLLIPVFMVYNAFVFKILWGWFIVTAFGLLALTIPLALGILILASMLFASKPSESSFYECIFMCIVSPSLALLFGWIAFNFI